MVNDKEQGFVIYWNQGHGPKLAKIIFPLVIRSYDKFHTIIFPGVNVSLALAFYGYCCIPSVYNSDQYRLETQEIFVE